MALAYCPLSAGESWRKTDAHGRTAPLDSIESRVRRVCGKLPVTRLSEISLLDDTGMAVFAAITPLAADLTTHMGKGLTRQAAAVSAMMEAVERISAETVPGKIVRASRDDLQRRGIVCADPAAFDLPPALAYCPAKPLDWVEGWDLMQARPVMIPVDLCKSPPGGELLDQADTNGLASGATFGEAIRHALLEAAERDATSQLAFFDQFGAPEHTPPPRRRISRSSLPQSCLALIARLETPRRRLVLEDMTNDLGVPVVQCTIIDQSYHTASGPQERLFGGWGADPCTGNAISRAVTEAHQSRIGMLQGARDSFNLVPAPAAGHARRDALLRPDPPDAGFSPGFFADDIASDTDFVLERLRGIGIASVLVADLTRPALGLPVVRVRVPGLSVFAADRRRPGWRCARHIL